MVTVNLPQGSEQLPNCSPQTLTFSKALESLSLHCSPSLCSVQGEVMSGLFSFLLAESFKTTKKKCLLRHKDAISRLSYREVQSQRSFSVLMQSKQNAEAKGSKV